jgi:hypothetical protein
MGVIVKILKTKVQGSGRKAQGPKRQAQRRTAHGAEVRASGMKTPAPAKPWLQWGTRAKLNRPCADERRHEYEGVIKGFRLQASGFRLQAPGIRGRTPIVIKRLQASGSRHQGPNADTVRRAVGEARSAVPETAGPKAEQGSWTAVRMEGDENHDQQPEPSEQTQLTLFG